MKNVPLLNGGLNSASMSSAAIINPFYKGGVGNETGPETSVTFAAMRVAASNTAHFT